MNYGKTNLVTVNPTFGGDSYELQARLSFQKTEDGALKLTPHFVRHEPRLDIPHNGYTFTDEDKKKLKQNRQSGQAGRCGGYENRGDASDRTSARPPDE